MHSIALRATTPFGKWAAIAIVSADASLVTEIRAF
jgi:hypothetical protein